MSFWIGGFHCTQAPEWECGSRSCSMSVLLGTPIVLEKAMADDCSKFPLFSWLFSLGLCVVWKLICSWWGNIRGALNGRWRKVKGKCLREFLLWIYYMKNVTVWWRGIEWNQEGSECSCYSSYVWFAKHPSGVGGDLPTGVPLFQMAGQRASWYSFWMPNLDNWGPRAALSLC